MFPVGQFQGPGACLVVEQIIREGTYDASQEKGQTYLFVLERYRERSNVSMADDELLLTQI